VDRSIDSFVGAFRVEKQEGGVVGGITVLREMHVDSERVEIG
jgi:hypothetical protein